MKKVLGFSVVIAMSAMMSFGVFAEEKVQYDVETFGSATAISADDYLLDGNFENGELVNGSIYYDESEVEAGIARDRELAKMEADVFYEDCNNEEMARVTPGTGVTTGISSDGDFQYNIKTSGTMPSPYCTYKSKAYVTTQSKIYYSKDGTFLTSDDYSYIVTLMDTDGNAIGSFRGYTNNVNGGVNFNIDGASCIIQV